MMIGSVSGCRRAAVLIVNGFGDQLISVPAMRALGTLFPSPMQLILGEGMLRFFYRDVPLAEEIARAWWADQEERTLDVRRIVEGAEPCDLFICLSSWATPSVLELGRRLGARRTVGYFDSFDEQVCANGTSHRFDRVFAIARHLEPSIRFEDFSAPPVFSPAAEGVAERYIAANRNVGERLLFLHPETRPEKMWARERFSWVVERFLGERPDYKVLVSSLAPFDLGSHDGRVIPIDTHLELTLAMMRRVDLFLGVDSCFLHAADLFRVPGVALFGPTAPSEWGFRLSPSFRHVSAESMDQIQPERVLDALIELAESTASGPLE
jgi:ADP-heptose:LPS heptosyltransferase